MQMSYDELRALLGAVVDSFASEPINAPWSQCIDQRLFMQAQKAASTAVQFSPPKPDEFNGTPMKTISHPDVDDTNLMPLMGSLGKALDLTFNPELASGEKATRKRAFLLMVWPFGVDKGHISCISNSRRRNIIKLLRDQAGRMEAELAANPGQEP